MAGLTVDTRLVRTAASSSSSSSSSQPPARPDQPRNREPWQIQKAALQAKFEKQSWAPRKRVSPDALQGIRSLHASQPDVYTTPVLAAHFKISPEAVRRILRTKWQPTEEQAEARKARWEKRGERKWTEMVEQGIRPPRKWREMGVGNRGRGVPPAWKDKRLRGGERWINEARTEPWMGVGFGEVDDTAVQQDGHEDVFDGARGRRGGRGGGGIGGSFL